MYVYFALTVFLCVCVHQPHHHYYIGIPFDNLSMMFPDDTRNGKELCSALFAEFFATMMYVYMGCVSVIASGETAAYSPGGVGTDGSHNTTNVARIMPIAMAFGMSAMVLVFSVGGISGGHINPAISVFLCLIRQMSPLRSVLYVATQVLGSLLGAALVLGSTSGLAFSREDVDRSPYDLGVNTLNPELTAGNGFLLECMGALMLIFVFFSTTVRSGGPADGQPNLAPLCIGFTVFVAHLTLVPLTGCGINPARTIGPALVVSFSGSSSGWEKNSWIYYIAPLVASAISALLFHAIDSTDDQPIDWDIFDDDDDGIAASSNNKSSLDVRKYRKPSSVATTGFASSQSRKMHRVIVASTRLKRNQRVNPESSKSSVPGESSKSSVYDIYEGQSHKFPPVVIGARQEVGRIGDNEPIERDDSHKFPKFAPVIGKSNFGSVDLNTQGKIHVRHDLPSVHVPPGRGTGPSQQSTIDAASSHKFPPVNSASRTLGNIPQHSGDNEADLSSSK